MKQPQLLVGLESKLVRVCRHWAVVDEVLPPEFPLVLLQETGRAGFLELMEGLPGLRNGVRAAELNEKLARAAYERLKGGVHDWLRPINRWLRGCFRGTDWLALVRRVPGRGQSYGHWSEAAEDALSMWRKIEANPPPWPAGYDPGTPRGRTMGDFETAVRAFDAAHGALLKAEVELKIARGALRLAQERATGLLMAYAHGVRARLGQKGALVRSIPKLWPKHKAKKKAV